MAVDVTISGRGSYAGLKSNISDYSAVEDATPLDPASTSGGVGQFTMSVVENPAADGTLSLLDNKITLSDGSKGTTTGTVSGIDSNNGVASLTVTSRLGSLLSTRTALPQNMTMEQTFRYYLGLGGITTEVVFEQPTTVAYRYATTRLIPTPGWTDVIFDRLRQFALVCGAEIALVSNNVVFRPLRTRVAENKRDSSVSISAKRGQLARSVEIVYYQNKYLTNAQVYPVGGNWTEDTPVYQVDAGETLEVNVSVNAFLRSVTQPTCVAYVARNDGGSVYSVVGQDGLAIVPAQWTNNGGSLTVSIGEDPSTLTLTIVGANTTQGPYRIAVGSGASDVYSSLRLQGTGTLFEKETLTLLTGVDPKDTPQEVGVTVDNPYISTLADAYDLGVRTAASFSGYDQTLSVGTAGINRADVSGNIRYPTFDEFGAGVDGKAPVWNGQTFAAFNTTWTGKSFDDFSDYYFAVVRSDFDNQAFGNVSGARRRYRDAWYRIDSGTITPTLVNYTASADTLFSDFTAEWQVQPLEDVASGDSPARTTPYTFNDFQAIMGDRTFNNFAVSPLWRTYAGLSAA